MASKGLIATRTENHEPAMPKFDASGPPAVEWADLATARMTYPQLGIEDQQTWLAFEHVNPRTDCAQGYFTLRLRSVAGYGFSVDDLLTKRKKTHLLFCIKNGERGSCQHLFLIDLRKALLSKHLAELRYNKSDNPPTPYLFFDVMAAGVDKFCERLRT